MSDSARLRTAWYPVAAVGMSMVAFIMIKTARDAVFFQEGGISRLPLAYIWIAFAAVPAAMVHLRMLDRWGARRTRTMLFFITAGLFFGFTPLVAPEQQIAMTAMFIAVPVVFAALFAGAWLLAGDLLDGASPDVLRIAYSRIGAASMIGGILGGFSAKAIASISEPRAIVLAGVAVLALTGALVAAAHRRHALPDSEHDPGEAAAEEAAATSMRALISDDSDGSGRYVRMLVSISAAATLAALFIDFHFYAQATISGLNNAQFFANFYIVLNAASLILQLFAAPRLQAKLGLAGALMLLPGALVGGSGIAATWSSFQARVVLKLTEGGLKSSVHRAIWEQAYLPIQRRYREVAKTLVDGVVGRLAEGAGAVILLVWLSWRTGPLESSDLAWILWALVLVLAVWLLLTRRLASVAPAASREQFEPAIRLPDS